MIEMAQIDMAIHQDKFDKNPFLFNLKNGTFDLKTGDLYNHDRDKLISKYSPVIYDPDAECPRFMAFLYEVMEGDEEAVEYLQRIAGYILTGDTSEQVIFILHGPGANGKTTLVEVIRALLGDYSMQADYRSFYFWSI